MLAGCWVNGDGYDCLIVWKVVAVLVGEAQGRERDGYL